MDQACPYARYLVGGNARSHAATTDGHAAFHFAASNCPSQGHNKIRIVVVRLRPAVAKVDHFKMSLMQHPDQIFLRLKSSMVGSDTDAFRRVRPGSIPSRPPLACGRAQRPSAMLSTANTSEFLAFRRVHSNLHWVGRLQDVLGLGHLVR